MVKDMLTELYEALKAQSELEGICIRSFERPESLAATAPSIVIKPVTSPIQTAHGSNTSLAKRYTFQVNAESVDRLQVKGLQAVVERVFGAKGFYQVTDPIANLEDYIPDINRYVDVRTYRGTSPLYDKDY